MRHTKSAVALVALAMSAGLASSRVTTDYDHSTDFGKYKTYSWIKANAGNSLWEDRIVRAVDAELRAKGWTRVDSGGDARVAAFGSTRNQRSLNTFYSGSGGGWGWRRGFGGTGYATTTVDITKVGTLVVDLFDARTRKLIWRGTADGSLSGSPEKNEKKLEKSARSLFKRFPPAVG